MNHAIKTESTVASAVRTALGCGVLVLTATAFSAQSAMAQSAAAPASADQSLSWHGITLSGVVDVGLQYDTHGAPFSDYHPAGSNNLVAKNSRQSVTGATPSNLSQSKIALAGVEPVMDDWNAVFKLETFFNPQSGEISDALKGQVQNNGRSTATQNTNLDSSVAGQLFETAFVGMSSKTYGTVTYGRQTTLLGDGFGKYDPNYGSQAFSLIGMSGTYAGGGNTEDKRVDSSLRYTANFNQIIHVGAMYKFSGSNGSANTGYQVTFGGEFAGASVDAYYSKFNSAVSTSSLSAAQVAQLTAPVPDATAVPPVVNTAFGYTSSNSLAGTISDNTTFALMGLYNMGVVKFFAAWEHIKYANPTHPLAAGFDNIGGYKLAFVNNSAYPNDKILNVYWAGVRYTALPGLDVTAAFYGYHQNSYATGKNAGCSTNVSGQCSGTLESFSIDAVYAFTKRFDGYAGAMYSEVKDGVANGYTFQRNNLNPTVGVRYKF